MESRKTTSEVLNKEFESPIIEEDAEELHDNDIFVE